VGSSDVFFQVIASNIIAFRHNGDVADIIWSNPVFYTIPADRLWLLTQYFPDICLPITGLMSSHRFAERHTHALGVGFYIAVEGSLTSSESFRGCRRDLRVLYNSRSDVLVVILCLAVDVASSQLTPCVSKKG